MAKSLLDAPRFAFDLEANGRFAYRARVCCVQIAWEGRIVLFDTLATSLSPLAEALGPAGPVKIVHDVAFDARMLAEIGIELANVHDTAVTAQMLGRPSTGLASLALSEFGIALDKSLQSYDWSLRPFDPKMLAYLATDVAHLEALVDRLWEVANATGIVDEILEETRYRLASALRAVQQADLRPAYSKIKGVDKLAKAEQAILRRLVLARECEAQRLDVPSHELVGNAALVAMGRAKPRDIDALKRIGGAMPRHQGYAVAEKLLHAVRAGIADGAVPAEELPWLDNPRPPSDVVKARKGREARLSAWRKAEALARGVNEQVVLPGHCLKDLAELPVFDSASVAGVPGLGAFRFERYGQALLGALATPPPLALPSPG